MKERGSKERKWERRKVEEETRKRMWWREKKQKVNSLIIKQIKIHTKTDKRSKKTKTKDLKSVVK
jgi:hypothetical protein